MSSVTPGGITDPSGRAIHHSVIVVRDLDASMRFYRDGLGLDVLEDRAVAGYWPGLFDGPAGKLRVVFLGDARVRDVASGVLELNSFMDGDVPIGSASSPPTTGLFMLSYFVNVEATLSRFADLGLGGTPRRVVQGTPQGEITIATVRDPDGVRILLTPGSITRQS